MKKLLIFIFLFIFSVSAQEKNTAANKSKKSSGKRYIDLEGLDIQGIIDRPGTLYILKKSKVEFEDTMKKYDYVKEIVNSTYKDPF